MLIGMGKAGIPGAGMVTIPIFATVFDARESVGILLPMLIFADLIAVTYYRQHTKWKYLFRLFPWAILGVVIALFVGNSIDDEQFSNLLSVIIIVGVIILIWREKKKTVSVPNSIWFSALMGILGGFTSMIGNAAGPVLTLFLLSMNLPKNEFIGTRAWFFLIINLVKLPLHIMIWETITVTSLTVNLKLAIFIIIGILFGFWVLKRVKEKTFKWLMISFTILSALVLLFR